MDPQIKKQDGTLPNPTWTVCVNTCDISDLEDATVAHMVQAVRDAYGETEIRKMATEADSQVANSFDVSSIIAAFRAGLPDPEEEKNKPAQLRNYRSETCELFAREVLRIVHNISTPGALNATKGNGSQPMLGFDGWGLFDQSNGNWALVLFQVKGSDDANSPPSVAQTLVSECLAITPTDSKVNRAISAQLIRVKGTDDALPLLKMLQTLGERKTIDIMVAPIIVRGSVSPQIQDLQPIKDAHAGFGKVITTGMTIGVGAPLEEFGKLVMIKAREAV